MLHAMFLGDGISLPRTLARSLGPHSPVLGIVPLRFDGLTPNGLVEPAASLRWIIALAAIAWLAPNTQELLARYRPVLGRIEAEPRAWPGTRLVWRPSYAWSLVVALMAAAALANMWIGDNAEFLYFQF
jgi:hypothetical protein